MFRNVSADSVSSLFSAFNTTKTRSDSLSSLTGLLSDYNSIRSGSYRKLVTAYYEKTDAAKTTQKKSDRNNISASTATSSDNQKALGLIAEASDSLKESADSLSDAIKDSSPVSVLYDKAAAFVSEYNSTLDVASTSKSDTISNNLSAMTLQSNLNAKALATAGITVNEDRTLSLDADKFKNTDLNTLKKLFTGAGSYGYQVSLRASLINYHAQYEASKANTYNKTGAYSPNYSSGSMIDSLF